jgi:mannose-6-phosphate isomerase-like protein (cupin superfamily)
MTPKKIIFDQKFSLFDDLWAPRIVARMNEYDLKIVKVRGEFVWHSHPETDEVFIVLDGALGIDFRDGQVRLEPGEMIVIPRGVEHRPVAERTCRLLLIEPQGTVNTGDADGPSGTPGVWV